MRDLPTRALIVGLLCLAALAACVSGTGRVADFSLSEEPLHGKFVWHDLIADDPDAARRFYGGLFGWSFERTTHPNGGDYTLITSRGRFVGGIVELADPANADYSRWLGYLSVPDVDAAVERAAADGGRAVAGPLELGNIGRAAAIIDPQGAVVGLLRSSAGDPDDTSKREVGEIVWNELLTADEVRAADFYSNITGAQARFTPRGGGQYIVLRGQERDRAGIVQRPADDIQPFWLTHFAVSDPAAAADRAEQLGGAVVLAPSPELRGGSLAIVTDPGGAILALHRWPEEGANP
ncbi:MAG: VOC family protein [Gammaproteobacteria bacterium]|nr:VOC family protein [Gammaproteobacteria bacterium]